MDTIFTIQEAAQRTGVSAHTLRYYERMNLLDAIQRDHSGYRQYTTYDLACVEFLTRLRSTKMPIRQMQKFAELRRQGISTSLQRQVLLEEHFDVVVANQQELNQALEVISKKIAYYKDLIAKGIHSEDAAKQIPPFSCAVDTVIPQRNIQLPAEPEAVVEALLHCLDHKSLLHIAALLQSKIQVAVNQ